VQTWTEWSVHFRNGAGEKTVVGIAGPEPEHVAQYARRHAADGSNRMVADMDALRERTVRATEWRRPSTIMLDALTRKTETS
jgi:hypothetical protein